MAKKTQKKRRTKSNKKQIQDRRGRPKKEFTMEALWELCKLYPTEQQVCAVFDIGKSTLHAFLRNNNLPNFRTFRQGAMTNTVLTLRQDLLRQSQNGNATSTWRALQSLDKNNVQWRDRSDGETNVMPSLTIVKPDGEKLILGMNQNEGGNDARVQSERWEDAE